MKVAEKMAKSLSRFVNINLALALGFILDGDKSIFIWNKWNRPNKFGAEKKRFEKHKGGVWRDDVKQRCHGIQ